MIEMEVLLLHSETSPIYMWSSLLFLWPLSVFCLSLTLVLSPAGNLMYLLQC